MQRYAKIIDEATGAVEVGIGDPNAVWKTETVVIEEPTEENPEGVVEQKTLYVRDYYESLGMELLDVEQAHDGAWYLAGKAPAPPETKTVRTFAKDAIWVATRNMTLPDGSNAWDAFKTFLEQANLKEGWDQQAYLLEENPFFDLFYPEAVAAFGHDVVDAVLAAAVVESKVITV